MFTPASPSTVKVLAATPGWLLIPAPTSETFPMSVVGLDRAEAELRLERLERLARGRQVVARDRERHVRQLRPRTAGSFWMIMSTLTFASASAVSTRPAMPGWSGSPVRVMRASDGGVGHGGDERSFHGLLLVLDHGTGSIIEA